MRPLGESAGVGAGRHPLRWRSWRVYIFGLLVLVGISSANGQSLQNDFTNRITYTNLLGELTAQNVNATIEPDEPLHGGKPGGHSLWMSWIAPANGVVKVQTGGSGFDTLLSVYRFYSASESNLSQLHLVASADDSEGYERESEVEFGVIAGWRYEVAVDGYRGRVGTIQLQWELAVTTTQPPVLLSTPPDRAANIGGAVTLSVAMTNLGSAQLRWFFKGVNQEIDGTNLVIASMQPTNVGRYKLRVSVDGESFFAPPIELQINTDGSSNTLAQPKFQDSPTTPLIGADGGGSSLRILNLVSGGGGITPMNLGVVRGYNGSQIFNTTYAVTDPLEPAHCNVPGGASYWLLYQPPTNGTVTLDTLGSTYDTVMEVYTYNSTPTNYSDLIKIDCSDNAFSSNNASRVAFSVVKSRQYLVAVDGVGGARGTAWLNYSLNTNQPAQAPSLTGTAAPIVAPVGATVVMSAPVTGTPPLMFTWRKNGVLLPDVNSSPLVIANVTTNSTASYSFSVTNDLGGPAQSAIGLTVIAPPACSLTAAPGLPDALKLSFPTITGRTYFVEDTTNVAGPWSPWPIFFVGDGQPINAYVLKVGNRFFRVRIE